METIQFKEHLSRLVSGVSVILVTQGDEIFGCTIGSLSASNITNPEVMFTLTSTSQVGLWIRKNQKFSISVLASGQEDIAKLFSGPRPSFRLSDSEEFINQTSEKDTNFVTIRNSSQTYRCVFTESVKRDLSEIFFGEVIDGTITDTIPLIYLKRKYLNLD